MSTVPPEVEELLAEPLSIHIATSVDDRPHVAPVWYNYQDDTIEALTQGKKVENIRANPRVALSVDKFVDRSAEWMVAMQGTASVVENPDAIRDAMDRVFPRYLGPDRDEWPEMFQTQYEETNRILLEIAIGSVSGLY